jgi:hypothetical protein
VKYQLWGLEVVLNRGEVQRPYIENDDDKEKGIPPQRFEAKIEEVLKNGKG